MSPLRPAASVRASACMGLGRALWPALALGALLAGCKKTPEDHLRRARDAIFEKKAHRALEEQAWVIPWC